MHQRCEVPDAIGYPDYGGRGIFVAAEWATFEPFYLWSVDQGYEMLTGLQIDRIDNNGPYAAWNCRWVDSITNARNKRNTRFVRAFGEERPLAAWLEDPRCRVNYATLWARLKAGQNAEEAIMLPPRHGGGRPRAVL
jgi:hypothetical protein